MFVGIKAGVLWLKTPNSPLCSGYAACSTDQESFLISNLVNGIDSYVVSSVSSSVQQSQTFRHPIRVNVPLQVTSALQGTWVICGSDDGLVRIFDQRTGNLIRNLQHGQGMCTFPLVFVFWLMGSNYPSWDDSTKCCSKVQKNITNTSLTSSSQAHSDSAGCVIVSGSSDDNPPEIKIWAYTVVSLITILKYFI